MTDILTLGKITSLALVNSVNPCQIAMLVLVLVTILTQNQEKKKKVLVSGLAFIVAVYIGYLFYGIVLVQLFATFTELLRQGAIYVKYAFAVIAMLVGGLQIKDFFFYKPGSFATEMPIWMRAKAKRVIEKITKGEYQGTTTDIVVGIREYNGKVGVDIREFTTSSKYTGPTKKGLRIPAEKFQEFKQMINSISPSDLNASGSGSSEKPSSQKKFNPEEEIEDY